MTPLPPRSVPRPGGGPGLPHTRRPDRLQPPPGDFRGVEITASAGVPRGDPILVSGVFAIPEAEARRIDQRLHRALVLVKMSKDLYATTNPFRDMILFEDDEERAAGVRRGYFTFDAFAGIAEVPQGEYHVFVSLGIALSNTVLVAVT